MPESTKSPAEVLGAVEYIRRKLSTAFHEAAGVEPPARVRVRRAELETLLLMAERQASIRGGDGMSGVKHTPVSGVHPDNTALRAVDACGGTYTSAEEASGWAGGHRAALAQATVAVGHADAITAHLLEALAEARLTLSLTRTNIMVEMRKSEGAAYRWEAVPELLANRIAQCDAAIARARGEQDGGGE